MLQGVKSDQRGLPRRGLPDMMRGLPDVWQGDKRFVSIFDHEAIMEKVKMRNRLEYDEQEEINKDKLKSVLERDSNDSK